MEQARLILSLAGTALSLFITCTVLIIKVILSFKKHKKLRESSVLADAIAPIMQVAESFAHYTGEEKKQFVLTKLDRLAAEQKLDFNAEEISAKIEELIKLSKKINSNRNKGEQK